MKTGLDYFVPGFDPDLYHDGALHYTATLGEHRYPLQLKCACYAGGGAFFP